MLLLHIFILHTCKIKQECSSILHFTYYAYEINTICETKWKMRLIAAFSHTHTHTQDEEVNVRLTEFSFSSFFLFNYKIENPMIEIENQQWILFSICFYFMCHACIDRGDD